MGTNLRDNVILETPDRIHYSSGVFISRERFVWVHPLQKFVHSSDFSMHVNGILVKDDDGQYLIFNHFNELLAKSSTKVEVNKDGYIVLQKPMHYALESTDGKNLYEEEHWSQIPFMGGKIEIPPHLISESRHLKAKSGKTIIELVSGVNVTIYQNGVLIDNQKVISYIDTRVSCEVLVNDPDAEDIQVYAENILFVRRKDFSNYYVKIP